MGSPQAYPCIPSGLPTHGSLTHIPLFAKCNTCVRLKGSMDLNPYHGTLMWQAHAVTLGMALRASLVLQARARVA